jgi:hypothetical protein
MTEYSLSEWGTLNKDWLPKIMPFSFARFLFHGCQVNIAAANEKAHALLIDICKTYITSDIQVNAWVISANETRFEKIMKCKFGFENSWLFQIQVSLT